MYTAADGSLHATTTEEGAKYYTWVKHYTKTLYATGPSKDVEKYLLVLAKESHLDLDGAVVMRGLEIPSQRG